MTTSQRKAPELHHNILLVPRICRVWEQFLMMIGDEKSPHQRARDKEANNARSESIRLSIWDT